MSFCGSIIFIVKLQVLNNFLYFSREEQGKPHFTTDGIKLPILNPKRLERV